MCPLSFRVLRLVVFELKTFNENTNGHTHRQQQLQKHSNNNDCYYFLAPKHAILYHTLQYDFISQFFVHHSEPNGI